MSSSVSLANPDQRNVTRRRHMSRISAASARRKTEPMTCRISLRTAPHMAETQNAPKGINIVSILPAHAVTESHADVATRAVRIGFFGDRSFVWMRERARTPLVINSPHLMSESTRKGLAWLAVTMPNSISNLSISRWNIRCACARVCPHKDQTNRTNT